MENVFAPKKSAAKQTFLPQDVFRKDQANPLGNENEEMKNQETVVFQGEAEFAQFNQEMYDEAEPRPQLSFEITSCYKLAYRQENRLSTGCKNLNDFLRGGFLPKRIYEVYGEGGTGKTQLSIQLLLNSILPPKQGGLGGSALFVMSGKLLNEKRFSEMKDNFLKEQAMLGSTLITDSDVREKINLTHVNNLDEYNKVFINLAARVEQEQIKLVIIDNMHSVCDNFIKPDGSVDYIERSSFMLRHVKQLKRLSHDFNLVVVVLNNVVADVNQDGNKGFFANSSRSQSSVPSLGLQWSNCINERIALKKKGTTNIEIRRQMVIEKSSYMRKSEVDFEILAPGLRGKH